MWLSAEYSKVGWRNGLCPVSFAITSPSPEGRPKFNMPKTSLTRDYPGAPPPCLSASLDSQSCHKSTIKTLGLPSAPPYAGIKLQLAPSDFNSSFRITQNFPFFSIALFGLRVKEWAGIFQANMFGRHSKKQNSLHHDRRCVRARCSRKLLVTDTVSSGVTRKEVRKAQMRTLDSPMRSLNYFQ